MTRHPAWFLTSRPSWRLPESSAAKTARWRRRQRPRRTPEAEIRKTPTGWALYVRGALSFESTSREHVVEAFEAHRERVELANKLRPLLEAFPGFGI